MRKRFTHWYTIKWSRVFLLCSPMISVHIFMWIWIIWLLPAQYVIQAELNKSSAKVVQVEREKAQLRREYDQLWREAHYLAGENYALNRSFDSIARISLQQAINSPEEKQVKTE